MRQTLLIYVDEDLNYIDFILLKLSEENFQKIISELEEEKIEKRMLCRVNKPKLLWDPLYLKSSPYYNLIRSLFGKNTIIKYLNVYILWNGRVWPPSIDSLLLAKILKEQSYFKKPMKSIIDMGCGTGFLGILLAKNNVFIHKIYAIDISEESLLSTTLNAQINKIDSKKLKIIRSDSFSNVPKNIKVDLIVCNPPYIPIFSGKNKNYRFASFSGTKLLEDIIRYSGYFTKEIVFLYSSVSLHVVNNVNSEVKIKKREILLRKELPFRVPLVLRDSDWVNYLVKMGGLREKEILKEEQDEYRFWHTIYIERRVYV